MNLGVLISGRGSNLEAILAAVREGRLEARVCVVISNREAAPGLDHARRAGVPTEILSHGSFATRESFDRALLEALRRHGADTVVLAGFDRLVTPLLLAAYPERVLNIHPALLPAFPGLHAQRQALEYGVKITGVTVHLVDEQMDHGPIIAQAAVPVLDGDDEDTLAARLLREEHRLYPLALQRLARGEIRVEGRRVVGGAPSS